MSHEILHTDFTLQSALSPLEQDVLKQYQNLACKLLRLANEVKKIHQSKYEHDNSTLPMGQAYSLLRNLRGLERKLGPVYTQFRAAVYALQVQNEATSTHAEDGSKAYSPIHSSSYVRQLESEDEGTNTYFQNA